VDELAENQEWMRSARKRLGWSAGAMAQRTMAAAKQAGEDIVLSQQTVSFFETKGKSVPRWVRFARAAVDEVDGRNGVQTIEGFAEQLDLVSIEEIDLAYGMGGTYTGDPIEITIHHFPRLWVETISTAPPALLTIARGRGDSMEPTIKNGDMVVINRAERIIREQDGIWALTQGDIGSIKRVRVRGDRIMLLSDNDRVPPEEVHISEINVVGRVDFVGSRK
jgi:phage repressor protein C with HTH and peptisase S24 domain